MIELRMTLFGLFILHPTLASAQIYSVNDDLAMMYQRYIVASYCEDRFSGVFDQSIPTRLKDIILEMQVPLGLTNEQLDTVWVDAANMSGVANFQTADDLFVRKECGKHERFNTVAIDQYRKEGPAKRPF